VEPDVIIEATRGNEEPAPQQPAVGEPLPAVAVEAQDAEREFNPQEPSPSIFGSMLSGVGASYSLEPSGQKETLKGLVRAFWQDAMTGMPVKVLGESGEPVMSTFKLTPDKKAFSVSKGEGDEVSIAFADVQNMYKGKDAMSKLVEGEGAENCCAVVPTGGGAPVIFCWDNPDEAAHFISVMKINWRVVCPGGVA